jgi:hypothetical protein
VCWKFVCYVSVRELLNVLGLWDCKFVCVVFVFVFEFVSDCVSI